MAGSVLNTQRLVPGLIEPQGITSAKPAGQVAPGEPKFSDVVSNMIESVNGLQKESAEAQKAFLAGEPIELHEVMIKAEEAGISMDLLLEIRNKLLAAYNEVIRMPM